jgi:hypothetical protein
MFLIKVDTEGGVPTAYVEDTLEKCVELAKYSLDEYQVKNWDKISKDLSVRRKWTDGTTTITITGK